GFRTEPLPVEFLGHLPADESPQFAADTLLDEGRYLFEEASCVRCHVGDDKDRVAQGLKWRAGPELSKIGARAHPGWIERWLDNPHKMRPGAAMPRMFGDDEGGRTERYAVSKYLATLGGPVAPAKAMNAKDLVASGARGHRLFHSVGCV